MECSALNRPSASPTSWLREPCGRGDRRNIGAGGPGELGDAVSRGGYLQDFQPSTSSQGWGGANEVTPLPEGPLALDGCWGRRGHFLQKSVLITYAPGTTFLS